MTGIDGVGSAQNVSEHAQTSLRVLNELYQERRCVKTPAFYRSEFTTTKDLILATSFCRGEMNTFVKNVSFVEGK